MNKKIKLFIILFIVFASTILLFIPTLKNIHFGLDIQGGFELLYKIEPLEEGNEITEEDLNNTYEAILNRIDTLGVSEPEISFENTNTLRISLPGVSNEEDARDIISTIALISFRDTNDNLLMTSQILGKAGASIDQNSKTLLPVVKLDIDDTSTFYNVTKDVSKMNDNRIVIWLDFEEGVDSFKDQEQTCGTEENLKCLSAAYVNEGLNSSSVVIEGNFTKAKVNRLASLINAGSLPTKLVEDSAPHKVSATFGSKTIQKAFIAGIISLSLISLLLIFKYRLFGLISSISLFVYFLLTFVIFNLVGGVLTLPGIAALILGIGMAIDSAIILIERIKDEYKTNLKEAYTKGSKSSLVAIVDSNITTLLVGIVLYIFGQSSIKGFATILIISIFSTFLSMIVLNNRLIKNAVNSLESNKKTNMYFGKIKAKKKFDFVKIGRYALISFIIVMVLGVVFYFTNSINLGIDFSGGTSINMISDKNIDFDKIIPTLEKYNVVEYKHYIGTEKEGYIKLNNILNKENQTELINTFTDLGIDVSVGQISTMVVSNLVKNALFSLLLAAVVIIIYMAIRFSFSFGISSLLVLLHDVVLIIVGFIIFRFEFNFIIVAAILTIIGYSINDTIVVFDRIRENKAKLYKNTIKTKEDLTELMNKSLTEVLTRNLLTSITTIISVLTLIFTNMNEIFEFNIAILIGLVCGTISSLVFAPNLWRILEKKNVGKIKKKRDYDEIDELSIKGINS